MGIVFCGFVGFLSSSYFLFFCPLVVPSCIPPLYLRAPLSALLMNISTYTHQKKKKKKDFLGPLTLLFNQLKTTVCAHAFQAGFRFILIFIFTLGFSLIGKRKL